MNKYIYNLSFSTTISKPRVSRKPINMNALKFINHMGHANKNHKKIPLQTHQMVKMEDRQYQVLSKTRSSRTLYLLLAGV